MRRTRTGVPKVLHVLAWAAMLVAAIFATLLAMSRWWGSTRQAAARAAWAPTLSLEALAAPPEARQANGSAIQLEETAARLGIAIAPRPSGRHLEIADGGQALASVFSDLVGQLQGQAPAPVDATLAQFLDAHGTALDALAADVLASEPPRWELPTGRVVARSPPADARADRIVVEAARLAGLGTLGEEDEHVLRPGTPRREGIVLLEEAMMLLALRRGRAGDVQSALRLLSACARIDEGVVADADVVTLGVVSHLAGMRLAIIRELAPPVDPAPLLGPALEPAFGKAAMDEAASWARESRLPPRAEGRLARGMAFVLDGPSRAMAAKMLERLHRIVDASRGPRVPDADISGLAGDLAHSMPAWDAASSDYIVGVLATWSRLRRTDLEAELTRRLLLARQVLVATGDASAACQEAAAAPELRAPGAFRCETSTDGSSLMLTTHVPGAVGGPPPFVHPLKARVSPR